MVIKFFPTDSRCLYEANAPQRIHWACIDGNRAAVVRELFDPVHESLPEAQWVDARAEVRALLERFELCKAHDPEDVKPIAQDKRLWEMRLDVQAYSLQLRIYETELAELPENLVALRAHRKMVDAPADDIKAAQDAEIAIASKRWDDGYPEFWGL